MAGKTRQRSVSDIKDVQGAIEQSPPPYVEANREQAPQTLEAALARIQEFEAANATLRQHYVQLQVQHAGLQTQYNRVEEDYNRAITNEDTVEEENENLRAVLDDLQAKYDQTREERDRAISKQYLAEEEALICLAHLQVSRNENELLQTQLEGADVQ